MARLKISAIYFAFGAAAPFPILYAVFDRTDDLPLALLCMAGGLLAGGVCTAWSRKSRTGEGGVVIAAVSFTLFVAVMVFSGGGQFRIASGVDAIENAIVFCMIAWFWFGWYALLLGYLAGRTCEKLLASSAQKVSEVGH